VHIADTHLFMDDDRGIPYQKYSNRMAKAYNETTHFQTQIKTNPAEAFEKTLAFAKSVNADVITLIGDNASGGYLDINFLPMNEEDKALIF